jgi:hypothetical protein
MSQQWIIEVVDGGQRAYIREHKGELYLTRKRSEAAVYATELDAKCAFVYVGHRHQPRLVRVESPVPG